MATTNEASQQANRSGIDPKRLVVIFYLFAGGILVFFLDHVLALVWARFGWPDPDLIEGLSWKVTSLVSVALSAGAGIVCFVHPEIRRLSLEVASEMMKVTWPSWAETRVSTLAVVFTSLVASVILFAIDTLAYKVMVDWLPSLWGKL
jgi:preprotein translocase subunit SecE